ncbi:MAG TPA: hypothetical protein VGF55_00890, partial [Gemmataceae bacterium]
RPAPGLPDYQRRELVRQRAGLILLAGRLQRDQAGDPAAAAVTFARIIGSVPEFQGNLPTVLDALAADVRRRRNRELVPQDAGRGLALLSEFDILDELARTLERLGRTDDAILTLARLNAARLRTRGDGTDESLADLSRLIQTSPAVRQLPTAAALVALTPPPVPKPRPARERPAADADSPFEWVPTNLGDFGLGPVSVRDFARLPDGRWVAALTAGPRLFTATSRDLVTWDRPRSLPASTVGNNLDPAITVDDAGTVWVAWFSNRLSLEPQGSGGYTLWLAHSADLAAWAPPRAVAADTGSGWPLGTLHWLRVGRDFRLSWRAAAATAPAPARITRLKPIAIPSDKQAWLLDPHVSRDAAGRLHMVVNDALRGIVYATSGDGTAWSEPRFLVRKPPNSPFGGEPHLFIDGDRAALICQDGTAASVRHGKLADLPALSPPIAIGQVSGTRWHRVGEQVVGFAGGEWPCLLRAKAADVFGGR